MRSVSIGIVVALVALAALGFLFKGYFDQKAAADASAAELAANNTLVNQLSEQNQSLESQIAETKAKTAAMEKSLSTAAEDFPAKASSSAILRDMLSLCEKHSVSGLPINTSEWASTQIAQRSYSVFKMTLQLSGSESNLIGCLKALQTELYPTLVIENLVLTQTPPKEPDFVAIDPTINLSLAIYAR